MTSYIQHTLKTLLVLFSITPLIQNSLNAQDDHLPATREFRQDIGFCGLVNLELIKVRSALSTSSSALRSQLGVLRFDIDHQLEFFNRQSELLGAKVDFEKSPMEGPQIHGLCSSLGSASMIPWVLNECSQFFIDYRDDKDIGEFISEIESLESELKAIFLAELSSYCSTESPYINVNAGRHVSTSDAEDLVTWSVEVVEPKLSRIIDLLSKVVKPFVGK